MYATQVEKWNKGEYDEIWYTLHGHVVLLIDDALTSILGKQHFKEFQQFISSLKTKIKKKNINSWILILYN